MKKHLLFLLLCGAFVAIQAQSTTWCPPGATWYYRVYESFGPGGNGYRDGNIKLSVSNTITLNGVTCQNMVGVFSGIYNPGMPNTMTTTVNNYLQYFTRENNGVVLIYDSLAQQFDTLANFNAAPGDKWLIVDFPFENCPPATTPRYPITVLDTGHVTISGVPLKQMTVDATSPGYATYTVTLTERMLLTNFGLFPFVPRYCVIDGGINGGSFSCYSDNTLTSYNPTNTICDFVPTVGIEEWGIGNSALKLYPNPNGGRFDLDLQQACRINIYTLAGQLVHSQNADLPGILELDLPQLKSGMYYLSAQLAQGRVYLKFVVE